MCSCVEAGFLWSREDSDGEHLCSEEVSGGFLRPSLEETLAYNRSISVREEEKGGVVGSSQIRFLMFSFVFPLFFFCSTHSFVSVFLLLPGQGVPAWTLPFVSGTGHQDQRREWNPSKRLYGLDWGYVFRLGLKAAVGCWIFPGLVTLSLERACSYGDCLISTIVARWVGPD